MAKTTRPRRSRRVAEQKDEPMTQPKGTMLELATKIDAAVRDVETRKQAVDVATVTLEKAQQDYAAAVSALQPLHTEYQTFMDNVLSVGGTVHVAKP
jgi:hypothetical protein